MTPKEKAIELYNKFYNTSSHPHHIESRKDNAKQCALIAVDEILEATKTKYKWGGGSPEKLVHFEEVKYDTYWQEVKQEIEKL
jgi:hypothetical protein